MKANHKENTFLFGREKLTINAGQFIMGFKKSKEELNLAVSTIHYWVNFLKDEGMVELKKTNKYTIITILNWDDYQSVELKKNSSENANGTQKETNKNYKELINNNKIASAIIPPKDLKSTPVKSKTLKNFRDARRIESGRPPMTPRKQTEKQKETNEAFKSGIEYFKKVGYEQHGMMFLEVTNDQRNAIVRKLVLKAYEILGDLKPLIDWWFAGEGDFFRYEPEQCFTVKRIEKFKNRKIIRQGTWDSEKINTKQGIWN